MRRSVNTLILLFVVSIGGVLGFKSAPQNQVSAENLQIPKFIDVPRNAVMPRSTEIDINLQDDLVNVRGNSDATTIVTVTKETVFVPKIKIVERRTFIPMKMGVLERSKVFNDFHPIDREFPAKINLARYQKLYNRVIKAISIKRLEVSLASISMQKVQNFLNIV